MLPSRDNNNHSMNTGGGFFELNPQPSPPPQQQQQRFPCIRTRSEHIGINNKHSNSHQRRQSTSAASAAIRTHDPLDFDSALDDPVVTLRLTKSIEQQLNKSYEQAVISTLASSAKAASSSKANNSKPQPSAVTAEQQQHALPMLLFHTHATSPAALAGAPSIEQHNGDAISQTAKHGKTASSATSPSPRAPHATASITSTTASTTLSCATTTETTGAANDGNNSGTSTTTGGYELDQVDSSTALTTKSSNDSTQCRICYCSDTPHYDGNIHKNVRVIGEKSRLGLVRPCACMGSVMFVHPACLIEWIKRSGKYTCEICHSRYSVRRYGLRPPWHWVAAPVAPEDRVHFVIFFFSLFFVVGTILWLYWLCNESVQDEEIEFIITAVVLYAIIDMLFFAIIMMEFWLSILPFIRNWLRVNQRIIIESYKFHGAIPARVSPSFESMVITVTSTSTPEEETAVPPPPPAAIEPSSTASAADRNNNNNSVNDRQNSASTTMIVMENSNGRATSIATAVKPQQNFCLEPTVVDVEAMLTKSNLSSEAMSLPPPPSVNIDRAQQQQQPTTNRGWNGVQRQHCTPECRTTSTITLYSSDEVQYDFSFGDTTTHADGSFRKSPEKNNTPQQQATHKAKLMIESIEINSSNSVPSNSTACAINLPLMPPTSRMSGNSGDAAAHTA